MKIFLLLFFSIVYLNGVALTLNASKEDGRNYGILHLVDDEPILCESKNEAYGRKLYLCVFKGDLKNKISSKNTPFVNISFVTKGDRFYIYIKPKAYSKMINTDDMLYKSQTTPLLSKKMAKHWTILLYEKPPFSKNIKKQDGINFPITYMQEQYPSVGSLDLNGKPIDYAKSNDIPLYLDIKKAYDKKDYKDVLTLVERTIKKYPDSIFMPDILLFRLRALDGRYESAENKNMLDFDRSDIIKDAKTWLKAYPTDKNTPEVLMYLTKEYIKSFAKNDANYYLDMLISEYPKNHFTQKAILIYADYLYKKKKTNEAIKLYEDVLYSSKDLDIASSAAIKLAQSSLEDGQIQKAKEYLDKVLEANKEFIYQDRVKAYILAQKLEKKGLPEIAANIVEKLLKEARKTDEDYETKLKDAGIWNEEAGKINQAYKYLKRYQKEFKDGDYKVLVQQALDRLFFELNETNITKLTKYYDELIKRYDNDIGQKALIAKAKLFLKQKKYDSVLAFENGIIKDKNNTQFKNIIDKAAYLYINESLKSDKCLQAVNTLIKHNEAYAKIDDKIKLFKCLMRVSRYKMAEVLAKDKLSTDNLVEKLSWILRLEKSFFSQGKWSDTVKVAEDAESLGKMLGSKSANEAFYERFFALMKLKKYDEALDVASKIEKAMPDRFKNVEVYGDIVSFAKEQGNDLVAISYAQKALDLEKKAKSYILSPTLEYEYIASLQNVKKFKEANEIALSILQRDLTKKQRGRALYVVAESYSKLNDKNSSKDYFKKCVDFSEKSSWSEICKENLALFDTNSSK